MFKEGDRIIYQQTLEPVEGVVIKPGMEGNKRVWIRLDDGRKGTSDIKYVKLLREENEL